MVSSYERRLDQGSEHGGSLSSGVVREEESRMIKTSLTVSSFSKGLRIRGLTVLVFTTKQQFFFDTSSSFLEGFVGVNSHCHHW